ncbi:MAG: phosphonate C-P lyase system protein PhnG [Chromatiales bacterium]|nr:phosphonate C-P lyase system protein PhnG [Gammaproteobacteria bacterium]MBW6477147.1 phosphonate C-P lyase system protein PhnG [Chromatiales bacterium]
MNHAYEIPARGQWLRLWSALSARPLKVLAEGLAERYAAEDLTLPQSGLGLLPLCDSALGDTYYLGELPLAQAHVRLHTEDGQTVEGAATLMDDRAGLARALAILDGVLAARLPGHDQAAQLLAEGAAVVAEQTRQRQALLAATRVDFSLLGSAGEDDDE